MHVYIEFVLINIIRLITSIYGYFFVKPKRNCVPPIHNAILLKPAVQLANEIRQGKLKSKDVIEAYLNRAQSINRFINAIVDVNQNAIKEAEAIDKMVERQNSGELLNDERSIHDMPLIGVPFSVKDMVAVKGLLHTGGLYSRRNTKADEDSDIVINLRNSGAIPIVITNVPELLMWSDSTSVLVGVTCNPYDLTKSPGGSSGGEGALISSAGSVIGIGSDVGGSIRFPASRCGIFGHKVTPTIMPRKGLFPEINDIQNPLNTTGPICRYANDLIPTLKAAAGDKIKHLPLIDSKVDLSSLKIFYMFGDNNILRAKQQPYVKDCIKKVVTHFQQKFNVDCINVNFKEFAFIDNIWVQLFAKSVDYHSEISGKGPKINLCLEFIKAIFGLSNHTIQSIIFSHVCQLDPNYDKRNFEVAEKLRKKFCDLLGPNGIFLYPTAPFVAQNHIHTYTDGYNFGYTCVFNVLGVPVTQCPLGLNKEGLPLGVQVVGAPYNDHLTLAVAKELECVFGGWVSPCEIKI